MTEIPKEQFLLTKLRDFIIQDIVDNSSEEDWIELLQYVLRFKSPLIIHGEPREVSPESHVIHMWRVNNGDDYFTRKAVPEIIYPFLREELQFTNEDIKGHENYFREASEEIAGIFMFALDDAPPGETYDSFTEKVSEIKETARVYLESVVGL